MSIHTLFKYSLTAITTMLLALTAQTTTTFAQTSGSRNETAVASSSPVPTTKFARWLETTRRLWRLRDA